MARIASSSESMVSESLPNSNERISLKAMVHKPCRILLIHNTKEAGPMSSVSSHTAVTNRNVEVRNVHVRARRPQPRASRNLVYQDHLAQYIPFPAPGPIFINRPPDPSSDHYRMYHISRDSADMAESRRESSPIPKTEKNTTVPVSPADKASKSLSVLPANTS